MKRNVPRIYVDTSVFGGVFDDEFRRPSATFFELIREGEFRLTVSEVVRRELVDAPARVLDIWRQVLPIAEVLDVTENALVLQQAYLDAKIVTVDSAEDALHVALASAHGCSIIVSWNFKHIVHYKKIGMYNAVNVLQGFPELAIHSPLEVISREDED